MNFRNNILETVINCIPKWYQRIFEQNGVGNVHQIGIDIGGTFTDFVLQDTESGETIIHKQPSTPADPSLAAVAGIEAVSKLAGIATSDIHRVLHGTTIATNIILQKNGAKVGLITTEGFRDILHIGRKKRPLNFSNYQDVPRQDQPIIPRYLRLTVKERVRAPDGRIETPLDEDDVRAALSLLAGEGVEAIAVCLLFSFLNPTHELRIRTLAAEICPDVYVSLSHDVCALHREYERFSTTALNAYVGPATANYTDRFSAALGDLKIASDLRLMTSAGGLIGSRIAKQKPVSLMMSGPVGALIKGIDVGREIGHPSVITLDVGGTSADVGVAPDGRMQMKHVLDTQIGDYDAMTPMVDLSTIGAGGGSIAYVGEGGLFQVGPRSAGATPGPACYGKGGEEPTVTDAMVCLGWLRAETLETSGIDVDPALARRAVEEKIAEPLGLSVEEAALGIYRIVCRNMIDAIRLGSISRGYDPREFALIAFGGAGAAFTAEIARELKIAKVVIPRSPGVGAAAGLLSTDIKYEYMVSCWSEMDQLDPGLASEKFQSMQQEGRRELLDDGFSDDDIRYRYQADCRYAGQGYELLVDVPAETDAADWKDQVVEAFHRAHERQYLRRFEDNKVQLVNLRMTCIGPVDRGGQSGDAEAVQGDRVIAETSCVFAKDDGWDRYQTPALNRGALKIGERLDGPLIIEQADTTVVVPPDYRVCNDQSGNLILRLRAG